MSIVAASKKHSVLAAALAYLELGISVVPCKGKVPSIAWGEFEVQLPAHSFVHNWHRHGLLENVGIVTGAVSGNLAIVDLDGIEAVHAFYRAFNNLLATYTVASGSGNGKHVYFYVDKLPPTTRTKGYELRVDGCQTIAPPSIHPVTNKPYEVDYRGEIKRVKDLDDIVEWITSKIKVKQQEARVASSLPSMVVRNSTAYGQKALDTEAARVAAAPVGEGNNTLYRAALKLGSLVTDGHLSFNEVEIGLMRACGTWQEIDRTIEAQCMRTIKSGLANGMRNSRRNWKGNNDRRQA